MLTRASAISTKPGSPKALQRFQNCISFLWPSLQHARKSTQLDAIDCFTNELVSRKTKKWEDLRDTVLNKNGSSVAVTSSVGTAATSSSTTTTFSQSVGLMSRGVMNDLQSLRSPQLGLDTRSLSQAQLDNLLLSTLEIKNKLDFLYLIRQCIRWEQLPSNVVLIACLKYLSSLSLLQQIESFSAICQAQDHPLTRTYVNFAPFKAMAQWRSGGTDVALKTLLQGYGESAESDEGRRMIRIAFRTIAEETLVQKSAAVLVALMEVARSIYMEHNDIFVVACVWKQCFVSEWFCDQKTAADLLEHYKELQQLVGRRASSLCGSFLSRHNVDAVHRLIEAFLQYNEREACANCLSRLFNYQYQRSDLRACAEIVKSCSELQMPLSELQNEQFLSLFLNQSDHTTEVRSKQPNEFPATLKEFQYKF